MPELPDIEAYLCALRPRLVGHPLNRLHIVSPFLLRSVDPPYDALIDKHVTGLRRLGKRVVIEFEDKLFAVIHLMVAGRFQWSDDPKVKGSGKIILATFHFPTGTLTLNESAKQKRASLHVVRGEAALAEHDPGGIEPLSDAMTSAALKTALTRENRTLKRMLTSPAVISGIGNAFSDEVLLYARLSPITLTSKLSDDDFVRLHGTVRDVLIKWRNLLCARAAKKFPTSAEVTAFRPEFAAHGRFGKPCPVCGTAIQRIVHASNETNYCPRCQTKGKLLADRSLSRLLKDDWPKTIEEWEAER